MTTLRVVVTETAERHLETIRAWWADNRRDAPLLFVEEVEAAFDRISRAPHSGALYRRATIRAEVRRILLQRTRCHVYYTCDLDSGRAVIRAVWHATRGRGPRLG
jgi:plasmid stabilization system protein ParE